MSTTRARRRAAVVALVLGLTLVGGTGGHASGARDVLREKRVAATREALERLRAGLDLAGPAIADLGGRIARVGNDLAALRSSIAAPDAKIRARRQELDRRAGVAHETVTTGTIPGVPVASGSLAELGAPLEVVSRAIHSSDQLGIELLEQQGAMQRQAQALRQLTIGLRQAGSEIAAQARVVRGSLTDAIEATHVLAEAGASLELQEAADVLQEGRDRLLEVQAAEAEWRRAQSDALRASTDLAARQADVRRGLGRVKEALDVLNEDMVLAEALVTAQMALWRGPVDGSTPPVAVGVFSVCPVDEPHAYSDDWGAPRWAGGFHLHQGNDIFAPEGTPIRAPFDGTAVVAENTLGGMAVKVLGEAGYVYNAHLSAYGTLGPVTAGTMIGRVGNTGDAVNSPPHDHFEFHPGNGPAVDPFPYLNAVC